MDIHVYLEIQESVQVDLQDFDAALATALKRFNKGKNIHWKLNIYFSYYKDYIFLYLSSKTSLQIKSRPDVVHKCTARKEDIL